MSKARSLNKYFIKQYIINEISYQDWLESNKTDVVDNNKVVGYLFTQQTIKGLSQARILNLYLIDKSKARQYVSLDDLQRDWQLFLLSCDEKDKVYLFRNPPIENWLDTKDNWCKKTANMISKQFVITYEEALSYVYMSVMKVYNKKIVYMGNLDYIRNTIINDIRMDLRYNRNRINQDSGLAVSSNTPIGYDKEGKEITIEDTLAADENESEESLGYQSTLQCIKRIMADRFSDREIDQIIRYDGSPLVLSRNLYVKLTNWRKKHKPEEVLNR